jgi:hypothetical protein
MGGAAAAALCHFRVGLLSIGIGEFHKARVPDFPDSPLHCLTRAAHSAQKVAANQACGWPEILSIVYIDHLVG